MKGAINITNQLYYSFTLLFQKSMALSASKDDEFNTDSGTEVLGTAGMFGRLPLRSNMFHRSCTLSVLSAWSRQQYCRSMDPWNNWELKCGDETELSRADRNFLEGILSVGRTSKDEESGKYLNVGFETEAENSIAVRSGGMCYASEIKDEFGCDFAENTQTDVKNCFAMTNFNPPYSGPIAIASNQICNSGESGSVKTEPFGSGFLKDLANFSSVDESGSESLQGKYLSGKSPEVEQLKKWTDPKPTSALKQGQETQSRNQALHLENQGENEQSNLEELEVFLMELSDSEATFCSSKEAENIRNDVESIISHICNNLKTYRMFHNCTLLKTGSTYEGLKIGKPDEFDFMIVLPALADDRVLQFSQDKYFQWHLAHYKVLNREFFSDLSTQNADDDEIESEEDSNEDELMAKVRDKIKTNIKEQLKNGQLLPPGWEFVEIPTLDAYTLPRMAVTPVLKWTGQEFKDLYISVDLSLAVPLKKIPLWTFGRQLFLRNKQTRSARKEESDNELLTDGDQVWHVLIRDSKTCRFSFSCQEQEVMNSFELHGGEKRTFRLVKFLRQSLMDQTFDADLQQLKSPISTYWLKTIMYYLLKKHEKDPHAWGEGHLGTRVLEIFQVLHSCLISSKLYSFFIPGYNLLFLKDVSDVASEVKEVIDILSDLKNGQATRQQVQQQMVSKMKKNQNLLYGQRREHLINLFYVYAYNDYVSEDLETIKTAFINRFFPDKMEVLGEGKNLRLLEAGCIVDIDAELERMYSEKFSYFS